MSLKERIGDLKDYVSFDWPLLIEIMKLEKLPNF